MDSRRSESDPQGRGAEGRRQGQDRHQGQEGREAVAEAAAEALQAAGQVLHLRQPAQGQGRKSSSSVP